MHPRWGTRTRWIMPRIRGRRKWRLVDGKDARVGTDGMKEGDKRRIIKRRAIKNGKEKKKSDREVTWLSKEQPASQWIPSSSLVKTVSADTDIDSLPLFSSSSSISIIFFIILVIVLYCRRNFVWDFQCKHRKYIYRSCMSIGQNFEYLRITIIGQNTNSVGSFRLGL